jgi:hypothetical protein
MAIKQTTRDRAEYVRQADLQRAMKLLGEKVLGDGKGTLSQIQDVAAAFAEVRKDERRRIAARRRGAK